MPSRVSRVTSTVLVAAGLSATLVAWRSDGPALSHPAIRPSVQRTTLGLVGAKERSARQPHRKKTVIRRMNAMEMGKLPAAIIAIQSLGLVGATVTGALAKRRRDEIHELNEKLRSINTELRSRETALIEKEAVLHYIEKQQYEKARAENEDPDEGVGPEERSLLALIEEGKKDVKSNGLERGMEKFAMAIDKADALENSRYSVTGRRELSAAYKKSGELQKALDLLVEAMDKTDSSEEAIHSKVALYGEIADLYTDMGDLRKASEYYDKWIIGM